MKPQFTSVIKNECGVYIAAVAGFLVALIFLLAYGLESGYLYVSQLRLQRSLDAAVTTAAYHYYSLRNSARSELSLSDIRDQVAEGIRDHLQSNLSLFGVSGDIATLSLSRTLCPDESNTSSVRALSSSTSQSTAAGGAGSLSFNLNSVEICDSITARADLRVTPLILSAFPGLSSNVVVTASASATLNKANVVATLDLSCSMNLDANTEAKSSGQCSDPSNPPGSEFYELNCGKRLGALKYATKQFVDNLLPGDRFAIVGFNSSAKVHMAMREVTNNPSTSLTAGDCDASYPGTTALPKDCIDKIIDGLTALPCTLFTSVTASYDGMRVARQQLQTLSESVSTATTVQGAATESSNTKNVIIYVSDGVAASYVTLLDWMRWFPIAEVPGRYAEYYEWSSVDANGNPNIKYPKTPYFGDPTNDSPRMYHSTINVADAARRHENAYIYTIGVGTENPNLSEQIDPASPDPYQDPTSRDSWRWVKQIFLHRLANDSDLPTRDNWPDFKVPPTWPVQNMASAKFSDISGFPHGKYVHAERASDLLPAFESVMMKFRTRLDQ